MNLKKTLLALGALAASVLAPSAAQSQIVYDTQVTTGADGAFSTAVPHYMQVITLAVPNGPVTINSFPQFGIRWNAAAAENQVLVLNFWTGLDTTPGATNVLTGATNLGSIGFSLAPQAVGSYNYALPITGITLPSNTFAIEISMLNLAQSAFSTSIGGRLNTGSPSVGSNDGFIYSDVDGIFAASERIQINGVSGNPALTNYRMTINATPVAVPEPAGVAFAIGAVLTGLVGYRRRQRASA